MIVLWYHCYVVMCTAEKKVNLRTVGVLQDFYFLVERFGLHFSFYKSKFCHANYS